MNERISSVSCQFRGRGGNGVVSVSVPLAAQEVLHQRGDCNGRGLGSVGPGQVEDKDWIRPHG